MAPDSPGGRLEWRVEQLEGTAKRRDDLISSVADKVDDQSRKIERLTGAVETLTTLARKAEAESARAVAILAKKEEHEQWAAEEEEKRRARYKRYAGWAWTGLAVIGIMTSTIGGFFSAALDQLKALLGAVK